MASNNDSDDDGKTRKLDDAYFKDIARKAKAQNFDDDKTQLVTKNQSAGKVTEGVKPVDNNRTRVYRAGSEEAPAAAAPASAGNMDDPPVAWLVATKGPGKGSVLTLGVGMNTVGRGDEPRISIPFQDDEISRGKSFSIAYDEKNSQFHLLPGEGKTLAYVEGQPVLERVEMNAHMSFQIGQTTFRFVPLCGPDFGWNDD